MAEFEALLQPYNLQASHAADNGQGCASLNVGPEVAKASIGSLQRLREQIDDLLLKQSQCFQLASKLYVVGKWNSCSADWVQGVTSICELIKQMTNLEELTWVSELPFLGKVWEVLPRTLKKLVIDISRPVEIRSADFQRETFISQDAMKSLVGFTKLRELRILGMRDSFQSIVWETVFRNEHEDCGIRILDLQMAEDAAPLVRQKHWVEGKEVKGLNVATYDTDKYKGVDGKGILHYTYGTGEYLDDYCMRKARIASKIDQAKPLPLWCLKLDGFVVDHLPLEHELSRVVLLTCGEHCIDAGLRAPKVSRANTRNKWGSSVDNSDTHCLIAWLNWRAIFDSEGQLLNSEGHVIPDVDDKDEDVALRDPAPSTA